MDILLCYWLILRMAGKGYSALLLVNFKNGGKEIICCYWLILKMAGNGYSALYWLILKMAGNNHYYVVSLVNLKFENDGKMVILL